MFRSPIALSVILAAWPATSWAHSPSASPDSVWTHWHLDPLVSVPLLATAILYGRGYAALHRRIGHGPAAVPAGRVAALLAGLVATALALLSPLDGASATLLSAHMVQHVFLVAVAPPLLVAGRPEAVCVRGLPVSWRRGLARNRPVRAILRVLRAAARPLPAAALHGAALWLWHLPPLFEAAEESAVLHALEHACFFGTALLFWRAVLGTARRREGALVGAAIALATLVHSGLLGALIGLSPSLLYPISTAGAGGWALTPFEDQHLAGAIMWVPGGTVYLAAGLILIARALTPPRRPSAFDPTDDIQRSPVLP